jgi:hypothetical protein
MPFQEKARLAVKENPDHWLNMEDLYSAELRNSQAFRTAFAKALKAIQKAPIEAVMRVCGFIFFFNFMQKLMPNKI